MSKIRICEISWHNIYLTFNLEGEQIDSYQFFVTDFKNSYPLKVENNQLVINVVNIKETKLLNNGKWYFYYQKDNEVNLLSIDEQTGYELEQKDKFFRYGAECYAYAINFQITEISLLKNKIMKSGTQLDFQANEEDLILCMFTTYMKVNKHPEKKDVRLESKSFKQYVRKYVFIFTKFSIRLIYQFLNSCRKKDGKHVLFMSETRVPISGNLKAIDDRMKERGLNEKFVVSYSFSKTLQQSKFITFFTWSRLLWLIAKQDYIFVDDYVPIFKTINLSPETKLVQVWHAGVGFKSVGYSRFGKAGSPLPLDSCHRKYDYALVGGKGLIPVYEEVFGIDTENFIASGLPRLDNYLDEKKIEEYKKSFYKDFPELKERKIIMFAPTYRGNTQKEAYYPFDKLDLDKISQLCQSNYAFIFKMHPFITEKVEIPSEYEKYIKDLSDYGDINEMFYVTDVLISDFSSNIYEFALHRKPMIFYGFDKNYYQLTRGVHRTLDDAPGVVCETFDEVIKTIQNENYDFDKLEKFIEENFDFNEKLSSDIAIDTILLKENK